MNEAKRLSEAIGFAVFSFGKIDITTVSPTRRGALVNWLVTSARRPIYAWTTDEEIERHWRESAHRDDHQCAEVTISRINPPTKSNLAGKGEL